MLNSVGVLVGERVREKNLEQQKIHNSNLKILNKENETFPTDSPASASSRTDSNQSHCHDSSQEYISVVLFGKTFTIPYAARMDSKRFYNPVCKSYLKMAQIAYIISRSNYFINCMTCWIILAGLLVGVNTYTYLYPHMEGNKELYRLDVCINVAFFIEVGIKILAEGTAPWRYFVGKHWSWNIFDLTIVIVCVVPLNPSEGKVVRLFRLLRLVKIMRRISVFHIILNGLLGGMKNIGYILLLLLMVYYLYAIVGLLLFCKNDPFYMGALHRAVLTLFKCSTMEDWMDVMYINMWGCNKWPHIIYVPPDTEDKLKVFWCEHPQKNLLVAVIYFVSFQLLAALVVMSLFIGVVAVSMEASLLQMKQEAQEMEKRRKLEKGRQKAEMMIKAKPLIQPNQPVLSGVSNPLNSPTTTPGLHAQLQQQPMKQEMTHHIHTKQERENLRMQRLLLQSWSGKDLIQEEVEYGHPCLACYARLGEWCQTLESSAAFRNFITFSILAAGAEVGLQTEPDLLSAQQQRILIILDKLITASFTFEVVIKIIIEEFEPWNYFKQGWNLFDLMVVLGSFMGGDSRIFFVLRLLRLLRVLKLVKHIPALQVIVHAIMKSLDSVAVIGSIILLFNYVCSVTGVIFFQLNDPRHYGSLHLAMIQLFKCSTREDWSEPLFVNAYGCDQMGYEQWPWQCTNPQAQYAGSVFFHVIFEVIGALVLLTLFIGVVMTSMEESYLQMKFQQQVKERTALIQTKHKISSSTMDLYREVFSLLDIDGGGTIEKEEFVIGLQAIGKQFSEDEMDDIFSQVDEDRSGEIDFSEFVELMVIFKTRCQVLPENVRRKSTGVADSLRRMREIVRSSLEDAVERRDSALKTMATRGIRLSLVVPVNKDTITGNDNHNIRSSVQLCVGSLNVPKTNEALYGNSSPFACEEGRHFANKQDTTTTLMKVKESCSDQGSPRKHENTLEMLCENTHENSVEVLCEETFDSHKRIGNGHHKRVASKQASPNLEMKSVSNSDFRTIDNPSSPVMSERTTEFQREIHATSLRKPGITNTKWKPSRESKGSRRMSEQSGSWSSEMHIDDDEACSKPVHRSLAVTKGAWSSKKVVPASQSGLQLLHDSAEEKKYLVENFEELASHTT